MNRRRYLAAIGGALVSMTSGCLSDPGTAGGLIEVVAADAPPNATVTDSSDERIDAIGPLQQGLQRAHEGGGTAEVEVSESEFDDVADALSALPWYDRIEHDSQFVSGIYIRSENEVFAVTLTPFCTDSWLTDAHSERGVYGWGGCIDREKWSDQSQARR